MEPIRPHPNHPARALEEVGMVHSLLRADPAGRVIHQQTPQQIQALIAKNFDAIVVHDLLITLALPLGKAGLEIWEAGDAGPINLGGRAQDAEDLEDLIDFAVAGEKGFTGGHLGEDATHTPHVDACTVLPAAEQDLRGAVPKRDDLVGVGAKRHAEGPRQPEVGELEVAFLVDEEVLWLQVAVQDAVGVAIAHAL